LISTIAWNNKKTKRYGKGATETPPTLVLCMCYLIKGSGAVKIVDEDFFFLTDSVTTVTCLVVDESLPYSKEPQKRM
jgi:hypothetical protein